MANSSPWLPETFLKNEITSVLASMEIQIDRAARLYDAAIIGGGPAGLSAALILGRCQRAVMVIDSGQPRNGASRGVHGFLSRDGTNPHDLRKLGREQLRPYSTVDFRDGQVMEIARRGGHFVLQLANQQLIASRILLFTTGREDVVPAKPGFDRFLGRGVYHCPLCDGWEHRDEDLVLYAPQGTEVDLAIELLTWSSRVTVCSDQPCRWKRSAREKLVGHGIAFMDSEVIAIEGQETVERVCFSMGSDLACSAVFFCGDCVQKSVLPSSVGCLLDEEGAVICQGHAATNVPGVYIAGNVRGGLHLAITAAAEGAEAAVAINDALIDAKIFPHRTNEQSANRSR
jgi:thioredoxin reductase